MSSINHKNLKIFTAIALAVLAILTFLVSYDLLKKETSSSLPSSSQVQSDEERVSFLAENLDTPWAIAILPDGDMLVTERKGTVRLIFQNGELRQQPVAELPEVVESGEGGLLGITLHPDFATNNFVYLYYTYNQNGNNTLNKVVRMTYKNNLLQNKEDILIAIPGASNHDGGRIKFGPDNNLYIGTGDAQEPSTSQNRNTLAGKILRVTEDGKPAPGNPFNNEVYSYGHRNVQGLAWDVENNLWATEHGRSGIQSGLDEVNLIQIGKNYGWPDIEGDEVRGGMETPVRNSGNTTWAPSGAAIIGSSLFFSGLRGRTLYEAVIENGKITEVKEHFSGEFGRIREVIADKDGSLIITTSNTDGRGIPKRNDDKVLRINPKKL